VEYEQDLQISQIMHLQAQKQHLQFLLAYHDWMSNETDDSQVSELHRQVTSTLNEMLARFDNLIADLKSPDR